VINQSSINQFISKYKTLKKQTTQIKYIMSHMVRMIYKEETSFEK